MVINLSALDQELSFAVSLHHGDYSDHFTGEPVAFDGDTRLALPPWGYKVFVREAVS